MKTELKRELFQSAINLCTFVNEHQITKENIQSIVENSGVLVLFYFKKDNFNYLVLSKGNDGNYYI